MLLAQGDHFCPLPVLQLFQELQERNAVADHLPLSPGHKREAFMLELPPVQHVGDFDGKPELFVNRLGDDGEDATEEHDDDEAGNAGRLRSPLCIHLRVDIDNGKKYRDN